MGLTGMGFSIVAMAAGAVMYWAVTAQGHGFRLSTVGIILMIVGAVGLVASAIVLACPVVRQVAVITPTTVKSPTRRATRRRPTKKCTNRPQSSQLGFG
jgi:hypothetical protein